MTTRNSKKKKRNMITHNVLVVKNKYWKLIFTLLILVEVDQEETAALEEAEE